MCRYRSPLHKRPGSIARVTNAAHVLAEFEVDDLLLLSDPSARTHEHPWNQVVTAFADYLWLNVGSAESGRLLVFEGQLPEPWPQALHLRWHGVVPTPSGQLELARLDVNDARHQLLVRPSGAGVRASVFSDLFRGAAVVALVLGAADDSPEIAPAFPPGVLPSPETNPLRRVVEIFERTIHMDRRTYAGGNLEITDAESCDVPIADGSPVVATAHGVSIRVPHPDDLIYEHGTPNEVILRVRTGPAPVTVPFTAEINLPSGRLVIGDAERVIELPMTLAKSVRLELLPYPADFTTELDVWITPTGLSS
jgi:hypothetical protein